MFSGKELEFSTLKVILARVEVEGPHVIKH